MDLSRFSFIFDVHSISGLNSLFSLVSGLKKPKYFFTNTSTAAVLASKYWNMDEFKLTGETPHSC